MTVENYVRTAPDSLGKKIRAVEETVGADTVHTPVTILENGSGTVISPATEGGNLAAVADNVKLPTTSETYSANYAFPTNLYLQITYTATTWTNIKKCRKRIELKGK